MLLTEFSNSQDTEPITNLVLMPSGAFLVTCSRSLIMRTYSIPEGTLVHSTKPHDTPVSAIEADPTSTLIATGGAEGFVKVWDVEGGFMTHFFKGHGGLVSALKFWRGSEGKWRLASGSEDCRIRIWNLNKKRCQLYRNSSNVVVWRFWRIMFLSFVVWIFRRMERPWLAARETRLWIFGI